MRVRVSTQKFWVSVYTTPKGTKGNLREEETSRELQIAKKREYKLSGEKKKEEKEEEEEKAGSRIRRRLSAN